MTGRVSMKCLQASIRRFRKDHSGNIAVTAAFALPLIMGGLALGADASLWFIQKSGLTFDTDGAAITATNMLTKGMSEEAIEAAVKKSLVADGYPSSLAVVVDITNDGEKIDVATSFPAPKGFTSVVWSRGAPVISARTIVQLEGGPICLLSLDRTAANSFSMSGSASASLNGCMAASNSTSPQAMTFGGSSTMTTECLYSAGGIYGEEGKVTTNCANNREYRNPIDDPFTGKTQPAKPSSCGRAPNTSPGGSVVMNPGCYDSNMDLKGTVRFNPGVYFIDSTRFTVNSGAIITGTDVTFILKGSSPITFNGSASISLKAPTSTTVGAAYPGVLFWGSSTSSVSHKINGDAGSLLQGVIYFPKDDVEVIGGSGMNVGCSRFVAEKIALSGNSGFETECGNMLGNYPMTSAAEMKIID